jgi:hypothetical protein
MIYSIYFLFHEGESKQGGIEYLVLNHIIIPLGMWKGSTNKFWLSLSYRQSPDTPDSHRMKAMKREQYCGCDRDHPRKQLSGMTLASAISGKFGSFFFIL